MYSILHGLAGARHKIKEAAKGAAVHVQSLQRTVVSMYDDGDSQPLDPTVKKIVAMPRIIDLDIPGQEGDVNSPLNFYVFGCAGDGSENQKVVATLLNDIAALNTPPRFCIMLGDNFYDNGVDAPDDEVFNEKFYDVYHRIDLASIKGLPFFTILGNHDHNLHTNLGRLHGNMHGILDDKKIAAQVTHTYLKDSENSYAIDKVNLNRLPLWNMPSHFYMLRWQNIEMFFIDSNTYVRDFIAMHTGDKNNQAAWLAQNARNPTSIKMIFLHHPLLTVGKRLHSHDTHLYLTPEECEILKQEYDIEGGYNAILRKIILEKQRLIFDSYFCAHDHVMSYHLDRREDNLSLCQVTTGGGGGKLQNRKIAHEWEKMPFFASAHGFVSVSVAPYTNDKKIQFDFHHLVNNTHQLVRFDNLSLSPYAASGENDAVEDSEEAEIIKVLRKVFLASYHEYMNNVMRLSGGGAGLLNFGEYHGSKGLTSADKLRNLFNSYQPLAAHDLINALVSTFNERLTYPTPTSLSSIFAKKMQLTCGQSFESFVDTIKKNALAKEIQESPSMLALTPHLTSSPFSFYHLNHLTGNDSPDSISGLGSAALQGQQPEATSRSLLQ